MYGMKNPANARFSSAKWGRIFVGDSAIGAQNNRQGKFIRQ
jgi:hypothetical protein